MDKFCTNCGFENTKINKFCTNCGNFTDTEKHDKKSEIGPEEKEVVEKREIIHKDTSIKETTISQSNKEIKIVSIIGVLALLVIFFFITYPQFQNYLKSRQEGKEALIRKEAEDLIAQQQDAIEDAKAQLSSETDELKKEIEDLKNKTTKQAQDQKQANAKITELKSDLKSSNNLINENFDEQADVVFGSIAKVICYLNKDKTVSGSGSVWSVGEKYYLVTNKHVLEDADKVDESCIISIARDWNEVANDTEKAYQDDNLLIYKLDLSYNYWDIEGFDFAITEIHKHEQPLSFLDDIAMETNESECNENLSVGEKIKIIGFPYTSSIALPTITEGIISSFEYFGDSSYYITSAKIEHGNSGGIAVTNNYYCMIGIPTAVVVGDTESLGRILVLTEEDLKTLFDNI